MARTATTGPREDRDVQSHGSMSIEEIFEAIENDTEESPNRTQNPSVTNAALNMQMHEGQGTLDLSTARAELAGLDTVEDQIEALKTLQSLIGRQNLRRSLFPTLDELLDEIRVEPSYIQLGVLAAAVMAQTERLRVLAATGKLNRRKLEDALSKLPTRVQKTALLVDLQVIMEEDFDTLVGR